MNRLLLTVLALVTFSTAPVLADEYDSSSEPSWEATSDNAEASEASETTAPAPTEESDSDYGSATYDSEE